MKSSVIHDIIPLLFPGDKKISILPTKISLKIFVLCVHSKYDNISNPGVIRGACIYFFLNIMEGMTTQTIYTRDELIALTNESIKKGHRALENALKKDSLKQHSYETSIL